MPKAYTYLIVRKSNRKRYIGARWANTVSPREDLGREYFTSSEHVGPDFEADPDGFLFRVLAEFDTAEGAQNHEMDLHDRYDVDVDSRYENRSKAGGHGAPARPVVAIDSKGREAEYPSSTAAAEAVGISRTSVNNVLSGRDRKMGGHVFQYADERKPIPASIWENVRWGATVVRSGGGLPEEEFRSSYAAAQWLHANGYARSLASAKIGIYQANTGRQGATQAYGFRFVKTGEPARAGVRRPVSSIDEHGHVEHFESMADAVRAVDGKTPNLSNAINGRARKHRDRQWWYTDEPRPLTWPSTIASRKQNARAWAKRRKRIAAALGLPADVLAEALELMTEKQREAFVLIRIGGTSWDKAKGILGVSVGAIADRLEGAEKKIEKVLQDR